MHVKNSVFITNVRRIIFKWGVRNKKAASGVKTCSFYFVLITIFLDSCTTKEF